MCILYFCLCFPWLFSLPRFQPQMFYTKSGSTLKRDCNNGISLHSRSDTFTHSESYSLFLKWKERKMLTRTAIVRVTNSFVDERWELFLACAWSTDYFIRCYLQASLWICNVLKLYPKFIPLQPFWSNRVAQVQQHNLRTRMLHRCN